MSKKLGIILFLAVSFGLAAPSYAQNGDRLAVSSIRAQINVFRENIKDRREQIKNEIEGIREDMKELRKSVRGFRFDEGEGDDDEDGEESDYGKKVVICHVPPGNPSAARTIKISKNALEAHLALGSYIGKCSKDGSPTEDKVAPVISGVAVSSASSTAVISWLTNEPADSRLWYSTSSPVVIGSGLSFFLSNASLTQNHSFGLNNLLSSTTYYFIVSSADGSGNRGTSTQHVFTTADFTAPVVSDILVSHSTSSSATTTAISWLTNEGASSALWLGTTTPLNLSALSTISTSSPLFLTSHQFVFGGLLPGTPYYFLISVSDIFVNMGTSTEGTFIAP